eukprot:268482-Chlamydomonas_euryale.AAC.1
MGGTLHVPKARCGWKESVLGNGSCCATACYSVLQRADPAPCPRPAAAVQYRRRNRKLRHTLQHQANPSPYRTQAAARTKAVLESTTHAAPIPFRLLDNQLSLWAQHWPASGLGSSSPTTRSASGINTGMPGQPLDLILACQRRRPSIHTSGCYIYARTSCWSSSSHKWVNVPFTQPAGSYVHTCAKRSTSTHTSTLSSGCMGARH